MPSPYLTPVLEALWPERMPAWQNVFVILDGARDPRIYSAILGCYEEYCCLYSGNLTPEMQINAPYLVALSKDGRFARYFINRGWGESWGIFLRSDADLQTLRRHFRRFLVVRDQRGKRLLFRYYDPRVLRVYLPTCLSLELQTVFGPVNSYLVEGDEPDTLLEFRLENGELIQAAAPLTQRASAGAGGEA